MKREWIPKAVAAIAMITAAVCIYYGVFVSPWEAITGGEPLVERLVTFALMVAVTLPAVVFGYFGLQLWKEVTRQNAKIVIGGFAFFLWARTASVLSDKLPLPEHLDHTIPSFIATIFAIAAYTVATAALLRSSGKPIRDWSDLLGPLCAFFVSIEVWLTGSRLVWHFGDLIGVDDPSLLGFFWGFLPIVVAVLLYKSWMRWLRSSYPAPATTSAA